MKEKNKKQKYKFDGKPAMNLKHVLHKDRIRSSMLFTLPRICLWIVMAALALGGWCMMASGAGRQEQKPPTEYELKAVCIYNFLKYTDWPKETGAAERTAPPAKGPIVIGVVGKDPFGKTWKQIEGKKINERPIVVKLFGDFNKINTVQENNRIKYTYDDLQKSHMLFICLSEQQNMKKILGLVKANSVLTVSETKGFLEKGGIINFLMDNKKVRFEINLDAAKTAKLQIKTTVLKLAKRVIQKNKV